MSCEIIVDWNCQLSAAEHLIKRSQAKHEHRYSNISCLILGTAEIFHGILKVINRLLVVHKPISPILSHVVKSEIASLWIVAATLVAIQQLIFHQYHQKLFMLCLPHLIH